MKRIGIKFWQNASLGLVICWASTSHAIAIQDPHDIFGQLDHFLGRVPFEQAFQASNRIEIETASCKKSCEADGECAVTCSHKTAQGGVEEVRQDQVIISSPSISPVQLTVKRDEYEAARGNMLKMVLLYPGNVLTPEEAVIESAFTSTYTLADGTVVPAFNVNYTLNFRDETTGYGIMLPFTATIGKGLPAIAQVLEIRTRASEISPEPLSRVLSVTR